MSWRRYKTKIFISILILAGPDAGFGQDEYSFDISAYEKSPYEFSGYAEFVWEHMRLDQDAAVYQLNFFGKDQADTINRYTTSLQLEGKYRHENISAIGRFNPEAYKDDFTDDAEFKIHEAYLSWQAKSGLTLDAGKKLNKWGKGYAWNPVGFIERPKDPNDPDLAREGFTIVGGDWIMSRSGSLQTIAITPVYLPVTEDINSDFGKEADNFAARIYFLYKDTDIDLLFLSDGSRTDRYGIDFARNISTNFEVHGEWAYITDFDRKLLTGSNTLITQTENVTSWLLGLRYLTETDTTYIVEYYFNGSGYTEQQMRDFYELVDDVPNQANPDVAIANARSIARAGYVRQSVMREYLYIRVMQKEPFDWLYFTPAVTAIINVEDQSYNLAPEVMYTAITNLELRLKINILEGDQHTEFGEKQNDTKIDIRMRYFF